MQPTLIGILLLAIGSLVAVAGSTAAMMWPLMLSGLMLGSAAIVLPALGGSSIPPIELALGLLVVRVIVPGPGQMGRLTAAVRDNWLLVAFTAYGVVGAIVLPRIFAGQMEVPPLRFAGLTYIYDTLPLAPTSQNITTLVYLTGTMMVAICTHVVMSYERGPLMFLRAALVVCWIHMILGVASVVGKGTPIELVLSVFRNGAYAQVDQSYNGMVRMNGIAPEPSSYAAFAFAWFVLVFECWLRGIWPRWTAATAIAMALILVFSTSASAYVGLAGYGIVLVLRLLVPESAMGRRLVLIAGAMVAMVTAIAIACALIPALLGSFGDMLLHMTVAKSTSYSGLQRAFWAKKGLEAFGVSYGLGIGPGSFRSSSLATAILGSTGVIGAATFLGYLVQVLKPMRASTYVELTDARVALGAAASWAAIVSLIPAFVAAPSLDPGANFAILAGAALGLRCASPLPVRVAVERPFARQARPA